MVEFFIDNKNITAQSGETILQAARNNGIYIPTLCYLSKVKPIESCRICVVEIEGNDGFVLSCSTPVVEGIRVTTHSEKLFKHRQNIMKMYNVNHPLECGVCDKSGECELQNKTSEFCVDAQSFSTKDIHRPVEDWGFIQYDPSLCIVCEKCVSTCNEVVGDGNLKVKVGGYSSQIEFVGSDCSSCGECMAVCPVGALTSQNFKYSTNAWELQKIPAICPHCSSGCEMFYETKHDGALKEKSQKIYRVTNDFEFKSLCGAGRFGYDVTSYGVKDNDALNEVVAKFDEYKAVRFSSVISNEEALILQKLKENFGFKLFNEEARLFAVFMKNFAKTSGENLYNASLSCVSQSDFIAVIGTKIADDNPMVKYAINSASKNNRAKVTYLHPIEDSSIQNILTQNIRYEVGTEEGVIALLCEMLLRDEELPSGAKQFLNDLDIGNLSAESNVGEEELELMKAQMSRKKSMTLIVGSDLYAHPRAENIAMMVGLLQKYSDMKVLINPTSTNTLGVANICELDTDNGRKCIGYNCEGEYTVGIEGDFAFPALNQQEGTFTTIDKMVVPTNAALEFSGHELKDVANVLGLEIENTIDMTKELPIEKGYTQVEFDTLLGQYDAYSGKPNGYQLQIIKTDSSDKLEEVSDLPEFNGVVIYNCNPSYQVNSLSAKSSNLLGENVLVGSAQFAVAAKVQDGDRVSFELNDRIFSKVFKIDTRLKGVVAINPTFGDGLSGDMLSSIYRFNKVNIKVESGSDE